MEVKYLEEIIDSDIKDSVLIVQEIGKMNNENYSMKEFIKKVVGFDPTVKLKIEWDNLFQYDKLIQSMIVALDDGLLAYDFYEQTLQNFRTALVQDANANLDNKNLESIIDYVTDNEELTTAMNKAILKNSFNLLNAVAYNHLSAEHKKEAVDYLKDYLTKIKN